MAAVRFPFPAEGPRRRTSSVCGDGPFSKCENCCSAGRKGQQATLMNKLVKAGPAKARSWQTRNFGNDFRQCLPDGNDLQLLALFRCEMLGGPKL